MIKLMLNNSDLKAQISDEDLDLCFYSWRLLASGYVAGISGDFRFKYLHIVIANRMKMIRKEVDHEDRNPLNCQRNNLRSATHSQNMVNTVKPNFSGFRGVRYHKGAKKWEAFIQVDGKNKYLGLHNKPEDAAKAYDRAAKLYHKKFAVLNFPEILTLTH